MNADDRSASRGQPVELRCVDCGDKTGGWLMPNGVLCFKCEGKRNAALCDKPELFIGIPRSVTEIMQDILRGTKARFADARLAIECRKYDAPKSKARYAVRVYPICANGKNRTVAVSSDETVARRLAGFWGRFINTEVGVIELAAGLDPDEEHLPGELRRPVSQPKPRPPFRPRPFRPPYPAPYQSPKKRGWQGLRTTIP